MTLAALAVKKVSKNKDFISLQFTIEKEINRLLQTFCEESEDKYSAIKEITSICGNLSSELIDGKNARTSTISLITFKGNFSQIWMPIFYGFYPQTQFVNEQN